MRFRVSPPERLTDEMVQQALCFGLDRVPWQSRVRREGDELIVERAVSDSCSLAVPWTVDGQGTLALATGTLRQRDAPYQLPLELARGKLGQLRSQLSEWEGIGLTVSSAITERLARAVRRFGEAVGLRHDSPPSAEAAQDALQMAVEIATVLAASYAEQTLAARRRTLNRLGTFLATDLGLAPLEEHLASVCLQTFNAANVGMVWRTVETSEGTYSWDATDRQIQWCLDNQLFVSAGPLLQLDDWSLPDWLCVCEDDFDSLLSFAGEYVQTAVARYRGKVGLWQVAGRVNTATVLSLSEEDKLKLAARAAELIHDLDPEAGLALSFDQPWGEYLGRQRQAYPPIHLAEALLRSNLGLSGLVLELNVGYWPDGTLRRDLLELSRMLDYWGGLGVPLYVAICVPSAARGDPLAYRRGVAASGGWTPAAQQAWVARYLPLLLSKPYIQGVCWRQLRDYEPHAFPHGGLFDVRRQPKPVLRQMAALRQAHLR
jgi:hypothetical protein